MWLRGWARSEGPRPPAGRAHRAPDHRSATLLHAGKSRCWESKRELPARAEQRTLRPIGRRNLAHHVQQPPDLCSCRGKPPHTVRRLTDLHAAAFAAEVVDAVFSVLIDRLRRLDEGLLDIMRRLGRCLL